MIKAVFALSAGIAFCLFMLGYGVRGLADHHHSRAPYVIYSNGRPSGDGAYAFATPEYLK